jgi:hypothetical protein
MRYSALSFCLLALVNCPSQAQDLSVYSDLIVLAEREGADLGCEPAPEARRLEVLSPTLPAGGRISLVVVVRGQAGQPFSFDVGHNPQGLIRARAYRYFPGMRYASNFFGQPVEEIEMPFRGRVSEGQRCAIFMLDLSLPAGSVEQRVKIEPAAWIPLGTIEPRWTRYPMEVRITAQRGVQLETPLKCEAPLRELAWSLYAGWRRGCLPPSVNCVATGELTIGSLLARQFYVDFPPAAQTDCSALAPEADVFGAIVRARAQGWP